MKKNILIVVFIFICLQHMQAQDFMQINNYETAAKTESTHAVDIGLIGAVYTYEYAFARKFTLNTGAGIIGSAGYYSSSFFGIEERWYYSLHPYVRVEPRYYYNLQKRQNKGKNTDGNTGSFLAIQCAYVFKPFVEHNIYYDTGIFAVAPYWGLRRIWWNHFLFEFHAGLAFGFNNYSSSNVGITLGLRLGYKF